jgi:hypothetical protein
MGITRNDAVIVTARRGHENMPDVEAFRESMPAEFRPLLVGPIPAVVNNNITYFFAPDGSKEGSDTSDEGDGWRQLFIDLFGFRYPDGSTPFQVVAVRYGGDQVFEGGAQITYQQPFGERAR